MPTGEEKGKLPRNEISKHIVVTHGMRIVTNSRHETLDGRQITEVDRVLKKV